MTLSTTTQRAAALLFLCVALAAGCPPAGEGEGEGSGEGEGDAGEGEGEGDGGEGEGEGDGGEGEGDPGPTVDVIVGAGYGGIRVLSIDHGATFCETAIDDPQGGDDPNLLREITVGDDGGAPLIVSGGWDHLYASSNGWQWTDVVAGAGTPSGQWIGGLRYGVVGGSGLWLSCGGFGTAMRSTDGRTWQSIDYPGNDAGRGMAFGNGQFVCSDDGGWQTTTDGDAWQSIAGNGNVEFDGADFVTDDGVFEGFGVRLRYDFGQGIAVAPAGTNNFDHTSDPRQAIERFAFATVSGAAFDAGAMPAELRTCLGL